MTDLPVFIAPAADVFTLKPTPCTYQALILLRRDVGDEVAMFEHDGVEITGEVLAKQIAEELQVAYDEGMAGHFQVLKVASDLTPHILNTILPATPLSPWQREFADAYAEGDTTGIECLAEATTFGDTIFTAVMVELDAKEGCDSGAEAARRLDSLIDELMKARDAITV